MRLIRPVLALLCLLPAACNDEAPLPAPAVTAPVVTERPAPTAMPRTPQRRLLDAEGNLLEAADSLYGFRLPMGVQPVEESEVAVVLHIQAKLSRIEHFYATRGYDVVQGKGGYVVQHSAATLADAANADELRNVRLYVQHAQGRVQELRFLRPGEVQVPRNAEEAAKLREALGEAPKPRALVHVEGDLYHAPVEGGAEAPTAGTAPQPNVRDVTRRIHEWQQAHPDEPFYD